MPLPEPKDELGRTALHIAAAHGNTAGAQALVAAGADMEATDDMGKTALHLAAMQGHDFSLRGQLFLF